MKKYLIQSIKIIAIALVIGWGSSAVSAWTAPVTNPPATGTVKAPTADTADTAKSVFAAINESMHPQIKEGGFIITGIDKYFVSPKSFFKKVLLPGADTSVYVGGVGTADPSFATTLTDDRTVPLTINMAERPATTGAIKYLTTTDSCAEPTRIITDSSAFQFWNDGGNDNADVLAKGIRLTGGNPTPGKILIAVDKDGRAVWATPRLAENGKDVVFDTNTSPVGSCNPVAPVAGCTDSTATNYNPNATVDNGSCVFPQPVDLCTNIDGDQSTVPTGMIKDTPGTTPGNCIIQQDYEWTYAKTEKYCADTGNGNNLAEITRAISLSPSYYQEFAPIQNFLDDLGRNESYQFYNIVDKPLTCNGSQDGKVYPDSYCQEPKQTVWIGANVEQRCLDPRRNPERDVDDSCWNDDAPQGCFR